MDVIIHDTPAFLNDRKDPAIFMCENVNMKLLLCSSRTHRMCQGACGNERSKFGGSGYFLPVRSVHNLAD